MATTWAIAMEDDTNWRCRWIDLVAKIKIVHSAGEKQELINLLCAPDRALVLAFANAHAMNSIAKSASFFKALRSADLVLRDGSGMATLFKLLKIPPGINLNGTDLIPQILQNFNHRCIALFGTQSPYLDQGMQAIAENFAPDSRYIIAHGFLDVDAYVAMAAIGRPAVIVLGMGMPKQERVASALQAQLNFPCLVICGGAIIDFLGGKNRRAPTWMRQAGLEWIFRLGMEPIRLFQRYVVGNPIFLVRAILLATSSWPKKNQQFDPD